MFEDRNQLDSDGFKRPSSKQKKVGQFLRSTSGMSVIARVGDMDGAIMESASQYASNLRAYTLYIFEIPQNSKFVFLKDLQNRAA